MNAVFVGKKENFSNFITSKHRSFVLNLTLKYNKISLIIDNQWHRDLLTFKHSSPYIELMLF